MPHTEHEKIIDRCKQDLADELENFLQNAAFAAEHTTGPKMNASCTATFTVRKKKKRGKGPEGEEDPGFELELETNLRQRIPQPPIVRKLDLNGEQLVLL